MGRVETLERANSTVRYRGIPWDATAKKRGPSKVVDSESEALAYIKWYENGADETVAAWGQNVKRNHKSLLFADYAIKFANRGNGEKTSQSDRRSHARLLAKRFPTEQLDEMTGMRIELYMEELAAQGKAPGTRRKRLTFLRTMFARAVAEKVIPWNPCDAVPVPPRITLKEHRPPTEAELTALVEEVGPRFEVAIWLANDSGLRAAEVCGLRWFRIDLDEATVTVKDVRENDGSVRPYPKGKETRTIPLSPRTVRALRREKMRQGAGPMDTVLRNHLNEPVTPHNLTAFWKRHCSKLDAVAEPKPVFHDLRHGCAHRLVKSNPTMGIHVLQAFMGHSLITTTRIYMPLVDTRDMRDVLAQVPVPELDGGVVELSAVS